VRATRGVKLLVWAVAVVTVGLYLGRQVVPGAGLYRRTLGDPILQAIAAPAKLLFQLLACTYAWRSAGRFEPGNPSRPAWRALALALLAVFLGQLWLAPFQLALKTSPFPSVGDVFFVLSYPLLLLALVGFLRAYAQTGLPLGSRSERGLIVVASVLVLAGLAFPVLAPVVVSPASSLEKALNVFYPAADFVLLVPTILLLRMSLAFRGGHVWHVWVALLGGIAFMCGGDVAFAHFSSLGQTGLDPLLNALFLLAYALMAQAGITQSELLDA
jgi:hypothetical protein